MKRLFLSVSLIAALALPGAPALAGSDLDKRVEHGYADSNGVKIHYASLGKGIKGDEPGSYRHQPYLKGTIQRPRHQPLLPVPRILQTLR